MKKLDDQLQTLIRILLNRFWICREKDPKLYRLLRDNAEELKRFFHDNLGLRLEVQRHFIRLLKVPPRKDPRLGIKNFKMKMDYVLFSCLLAFIQDNEQFLLRNLCDELLLLYPSSGELDWSDYQHRLSLIRVLKLAMELQLIRVVEGDLDKFSTDLYKEHEVLYNATDWATSFMRTFPRSINEYPSVEEFINDQDFMLDVDPERSIKQNVLRHLLFSPVVYNYENQEHFQFICKRFRGLKKLLTEYVGMDLELHKNAALVFTDEFSTEFTIFPDLKPCVNRLVLLFARHVRRNRGELAHPIQSDGSISITFYELDNWIYKSKECDKSQWTKEYLNKPVSWVRQNIFEVLIDWKMAEVDHETSVIKLMPLFGRVIGKRFEQKIGVK